VKRVQKGLLFAVNKGSSTERMDTEKSNANAVGNGLSLPAVIHAIVLSAEN